MGIISKKTSLVSKDSREIAKMEEGEIFIENIKESDLPSIVGGQIEKYKELEKSINESIKRAEKAEKSADSAYKESAGFFNRKNAIEATQSSGIDSAEAIMALAGSQKISFEFQTKLAEISKFLLMLGVSNIALNRTTVRQLQLKLEGASKDKLSELVKTEIRNVIQQLKVQQDIFEKQKNLEEGTKKLHANQEAQTAKVEEHDNLLGNYEKKIKENIKTLKSNSEKIQFLNDEIKNHEKTFNTIKRSIKKYNNRITSIEKDVNEIKEFKDYIFSKYPKIKVYLFIICGIIVTTFILSISSIIYLLIKS
jgi:hypothetical protein